MYCMALLLSDGVEVDVEVDELFKGLWKTLTLTLCLGDE